VKLQACLGRQGYVFLPRRRGSRSSCPCADHAADQGSLAPTSQSANQCPARGATADESKVALVVIIPGFSDSVGVDVKRLTS
jgi:hypothetical protein